MAGKKSPSIFSTLQKTTENASGANGELTRQLSVDCLVDNPLNRFSMAEDEEFLSTMRSVEQDGFLEDIVVTPHTDNTWRIISGHRRVLAARKLGKATVPCKVRRYPDKLAELRALMGANVHRRNISPFDMAHQLETLRDTLAEEEQLPENVKEQAELMAEQSGLSRATVERYLDLLNLDGTMAGWAERGDMTMTDAYEMAQFLMDNGVKGIWNFTNVELSGNVFFENVHFADSLLTLSYRITKHFSPGVKEPK